MRSRSGLLAAAAVAFGIVAWAAAVAGPGSGSASITPSSSVAAGSSGTWSIVFTAAEPMQSGRLRITIPAGWTTPQSGNSSGAGFVTVSTNQPSAVPLLSVGGQIVTIDVDTLSVGNTVTLVYGNDSISASARATAATAVNPYTFLVESDPTGTNPDPLVSSPALNVIAAAPNYLEIAPSDTSVTAGAFAEYRIIVRDEFGNRAPVSSSRTVGLFPASGAFYATSDHGTPIASINIAAGKTSARLDYRGTLATPAGSPHALTVFTTSGSPSLGGYDVVNIAPAALSTTVSTVEATTPVTADGTSQSSVTVTSKDAFGNPRDGDTVTISATGSAVENNPGSPTDENGEATGVVTNTVAQNVTVSATINAQPITDTAVVQFTAGPVSGATSTVDATSPITANGVTASTITVTARDANSNPIQGLAVTLAVAPPGGGAVLTQPGGVTNALGVATGTLTSTTTGSRTVTATIGATPVTDNAVVLFNAGAVASFTWSGIDGAAVAGVAEPVTITARDAQGNIITNYTGTVNLTTSSTGVGDAVVQWSAPGAFGTLTNQSGDDAQYTFAAGDNGVATLQVTDTKAETITLAASGPASGVSSAIVVAPGAADQVELVEGNGQSATVNAVVATKPKVRVLDAFDNAVPGATVTFRLLTAGGFVDVVSGGGTDSTGTTAPDGTIDCDVWRMATSTAANPNRLRALIASGSAPSFTFTATATAGNGATLVLTPGSKNVTVSSTEVVTATLTDSFGNLKSGEQVTVAVKTGIGTLAEDPGDPGTTTQVTSRVRQGNTDAAGKITVLYQAPGSAGNVDVLDASTPNVAQGAVADVTYTTIASGATNLRITFVGSSTQPAGTAAQFTIEAVDGGGNRDTGNTSNITLTPGGGGLQFSLTNFGAPITNASLVAGVRTIYVRGTTAGSFDITASGGALGDDTDVFTVTDTGVIDTYTVSTVPGVVAGASFNVSVSARDQYDNLVDGANNSITLEAIDDVTTGQATGDLLVANATLSSGQATVAEQYTVAEAIRVRVFDGSSNEGTSAIVNVSAAAAKRITKVSGDLASVPAGGNQVLTARVLDQYDNPVSGTTVSFLVTQGNGSVLPASDPSDAGTGNAATTLTTDVVAGLNRVRATILDGSPAIDEVVEFSVTGVAGGIAYFTVVPQTTSLTAGQTVPLTITAYDSGDNVVTSDNTTQVGLSSSTGSAQFGATPGTLTAGVYTTTVRHDVAQSFTVTATRVGGGPTGTSASISVANAGTHHVDKVSGDASGIGVGAAHPLTVVVRDLYNNPVSGALVTFSVLSAPDGTPFFTDTDGDPNDGIAVADGSGNADVTYHTAQTAGANQVNAQILDGSPAGLEKETFVVNTVSSSATKLRITFLSASTVAANQTFSFKVEALDASNNLDTGNTSTVTITPEALSGLLFSATDFGATTTTFALVGGTRTIYGRGTTAGNWDIAASAGGLTGDADAVTITHTGVVTSYFVTAAAGAQAGSPFTVNIEARDTYGNKVTTAANTVFLVPVDDVTTAVTGLPFSVTQANLVAGAVTVNQSYTRAELLRVRARDAGSFEGYSNVVQITPAGAYRVTNLSGDGSGIVAGTTRVLTARVLDPYDNPVQGQLVSFSAVSGGGSTAPPSGSTNASGDVQTTLTTGTVAGTNVARATILDGTPSSLETDDFTVNTVAGPIANYEVTVAKTSLVANEQTNVTIRARDANGNYRTLDNSTNITISATGGGILGATAGTLSAGQFVTTVRNTAAGTFTVSAQTQGDTENGTSPLITVTNGPAFRVVEVSGDAVSVPVGIVQPLRTEVQDQWGNTVANQPVRYQITSSPAGAFLGDAVADTADGITATVANGRAVVRLHTSSTVGTATVTATILDGNPSNEESKTFTVTTVAGGIAYYTVQMSSTSTTAGVSKTATITAYDVDDNVVNDDATQVVLGGDPGNGLVFGQNPVTLSNGVASTSVTASLVQTYRVRASTVGNPSITGLGPDVTVVPAAPAGTISATATQNTITANGTSTTTITSGVIRDAFTNQVVEGLIVNVLASIGGTIVGGPAKTIGADGRISFQLQSSNTTGNSTVTMTSATGTATGSLIIAFAPKPNLTAGNPPTPSTVVPGSSVSFGVLAGNSSPTDANLTTATTFSFTDGTRTYIANLSAPQTVPGSGSVTLNFDAATVNSAFIPANYQPVVTMIGTDEHGSGVNVPVSLPAASLKVTSIEITSIVPASGIVSRGQNSTIAVTVKNNGTQSTVINNVDLDFIPGALITVGNAPQEGTSLNAGASGVFQVPIAVQAGATEGMYLVDAVASGTVGGETVTDDAVAPHPRANLQITTAASLVYQSSTLTPTTVSRGDPYAFQMTLRNDGGGLVVLDSSLTRLTFTDGTRTYSAAPSQPYAIAGGGATQVMTFRVRTVQTAFTPGTYPVTLNAGGTDNGSPFTPQLVPLTGSPVTVQAPATIVSAAGEAVNPETVSKTTSATFSVTLQNNGGATVVLTPATTTFRFSGSQYTTTLNPSGPATLPPGQTTLQFLGAVVSSAITPGAYNPTVQLTGTENGTPFSQSIALTDDVVVQNAPSIAILDILPSQTQFTTDQAKPIKVRMVVRNNNGASANFTAASIRFIHGGQERTGQFVISTPATFQGGSLLTSGETDTVLFNVSDNTGPMTAGNMTIEGDLEVEDVNTNQPVFADTDVGGKGNLMVMTPASIAFDAVIPSQAVVTQSMARDIKVRAVVRNTGGSEAVLNLASPSTRLNFSPSPGWTITSPATLSGGGNTLSGGELDTLVFNVTTSGSTPGPATVSVTASGTETNSNNPVTNTSTPANLLVETPGAIQIVSVVPSQPSITSATTVPWTITVTLTNPGESDVNLALGASVGLTIQNQATPPAFVVPAALAGGGTLLSGGETDQLVIPLSTSGTYSSFGLKSITVDIDGTEVNSAAPRNGNDTGTVLVQGAPNPSFVSLTPGTVSKLTNVAFAVDVINDPQSNRATMTLDRALTRLRFGSGQFNVGLSQASPVDIAQGATETLQFTGATIGAGIPTGVQNDAELELHWIHNGVAGTEIIDLGSAITVQNAPALSISSVRPARSTLTRNQNPATTVTMVIRNSGGAPVNLDLSPVSTHLGFKVLGSGATVTGEYIVQAPAGLEAAGGTVLAGGATDSLVFNIATAGTTTGSIILNGYLGGIDMNSSLPVSDDTFDGGSGSLELQLAGALSILSITPSQTTATVGQTTKSYVVKMAVRNTGGAAIDIGLSQASSDVQFTGTTGFVHGDAVMTGGNTLSGGETDTLRFTVNTTGGPAGLSVIAGNVSGTENNTGSLKVDDTASGGTGAITLQTPAVLVVNSVTPSQPSVTTSTSAAWTTTISVSNTGQSDARLNLPAGLILSIQHSTGGTTFVKPLDLEEGGVILAGGASGTLVATTTATGTFSSLGTKSLDATVGATELNSNRALSVQGSGTIVVQSMPNLVVTAIRPVLVTSESIVDFEVDVQNPLTSNATVRFDRGDTRAHFASQAFSAFLDVASPDSIAGGDTETLRFEAKLIPASVAIGPHNFTVNLDYDANGIARTEPEVVTNGVTVQEAPQLAIQSIVVSQPSATAGQLADWDATMTVMNNGTAQIDLDLDAAKTRLTFIGPGGQPDLSYFLLAPAMVSGDDILDPNETAQIRFTVTQTGVQTGNIVISGRVEGRDLNQLSIVTDDTFDGGRGSILVQSAPGVAIVATNPSQPRVTVGQTGWSVRVVVQNTGGADVAINLATAGITIAGGGWTTGAATLFGGGNVLEGGATDSLLVPITAHTTGSAGTRRLDANVPWTEINTQTSDAANTSTSGSGLVVVESRPSIRITTTTIVAPNPAAVNVNQAFNVAVQIQNTGQADARNVVVGMTTNSASGIQPVAPLAVVPGGQAVSYNLPVIAASAADASETFTTTISSAIDENSGQASLVTITNPPADPTATLAVEAPAALAITNVRPSQTTVTRGQTNPWNVIVRVRNTGGADAMLTPPGGDDLDFSLAGSTKIDYAVTPPAQFGSGAAGWTLAGGATDSLIYNVVDTGNDPGTVDIGVGVAGTDFNDPAQNVSAAGATTVNVQDVAGLYIASTVPVGTFNHATAERDTVNTRFQFEIHVTVQNSGGEDVDSVLVNLGKDGASTIVAASLKRQSIAASASRDFVFRITAGASPAILETFQATILPGVVSHNSNEPVIPQQPVDRRHDIVIQARASLLMNLFVVSPPGSAGGVVAASQLFTLGAVVTNPDSVLATNPPRRANVSGPAEVTLAVPSGFSVQENLVRAFAVDDTVKWTVTAPPTIQSAQNFTGTITTTPSDVNTAATAFVSQGSDNQSITVSSGGALVNPTVALISPPGASDDTLSVSQAFTLRANVTVSRIRNLTATITLPSGFSIVNGGPVRNLGNTAGTRQVDYNLSASTLPASLEDLFVTFAAVDTITGDPVPSAADTVRVTVVPRTSLSVSALVTDPPAASDNTVAIGTPFTVTATVANAAGAADIAAPGSLQLALPAGYSFAAGHTAQKPFVVGMPVWWVVNAAAQPKGPDQLTISIVNIPDDENSALPAQVTVGAANIPMVTEGAAVSVADISEAQQVGIGVAPGGATNLDVLAFRIAYNVTDITVDPAQVDTISLTIIDRSGNPLSPGAVNQTLSRIAIDLGGTTPYAAANLNANPVLVDLTGGGTDREINPDGSINAVVYLDLDASPRATEFRVRVGGGMVVSDPGSGKLGVTDALGQPLTSQVTSGPLVVLSSNFEEYAHNYPNPFRAGSDQTRIAYFLDSPANVTVRIFDVTGALVYEESIPSSDPRAQAGPQETTWDGRNGKGETVRNGIYVCVLDAGSRSAKFRIAVAK